MEGGEYRYRKTANIKKLEYLVQNAGYLLVPIR